MTDDADNNEAAALIARQTGELSDLAKDLSRVGAKVTRERVRRWKQRTTVVLRGISVQEAERFDRLSERASFVSRDENADLLRTCDDYAAFLIGLGEELQKHPSSLRIDAGSVVTPAKDSNVDRDAVFIIHGHDEPNRLKLEKLLQRWGLRPVVLLDVAGKGRTLIEKFEQVAARCSFALAIVTADDLVKTPKGEYAQARPNVAFELGWFYGRLGRNNVCILLERGTKLHSDLDGISVVEFEGSIESVALKIEDELKAAEVLKVGR